MPGAALPLESGQLSPASVVAELNAVVGVALEAANDDDAIFLTVGGALVYQYGAELCVPLFHVLYLRVGLRSAHGDSPEAPDGSDQMLSVTCSGSGFGAT